MNFKFTVQVKVQKPVSEVFDAVYNPKKLSSYFTADSDGPLDEGKTVLWKHAAGECQHITIPVKVERTVRNELIRFTWAASEGAYNPKTAEFPHPAGYDNTVEVEFEALGPSETLVRITEGTWKESPGGLESSYQNCQGWMHMACCMKAFLEYGINLRKGSF
jgi:uncharacterized protein YndB with AHSA1/START domain